MLWALDEVANIAPVHDLPALISQSGGQHRRDSHALGSTLRGQIYPTLR